MKTILVTGANGGLGTAVVKKFLDSGYTVLAVDSADNHLGFAKGKATFHFSSVDLTNSEAARSFIHKACSDHKKIDGALLLVGGFAMGNILNSSLDDVKKMFQLNFETAFNIVQPLFSHLQENNFGRIVFVGARPALQPSQGRNMIAYALSKSLLFKLAELLNEQGKNKNVVTSVIVPSTIDTPANRTSMPEADPAKWVTPAEIADILELICSDKTNAIREPVYKIYGDS